MPAWYSCRRYRPPISSIDPPPLSSIALQQLIRTHGISREGNRRLHRRQRNQLEDVVWDHIAQRARLIVVAATLLHADGLGHGDLDVVDIATVPDGFENAVGKPEHHLTLSNPWRLWVPWPLLSGIGEAMTGRPYFVVSFSSGHSTLPVKFAVTPPCGTVTTTSVSVLAIIKSP